MVEGQVLAGNVSEGCRCSKCGASVVVVGTVISEGQEVIVTGCHLVVCVRCSNKKTFFLNHDVYRKAEEAIRSETQTIPWVQHCRCNSCMPRA